MNDISSKRFLLALVLVAGLPLSFSVAQDASTPAPTPQTQPAPKPAVPFKATAVDLKPYLARSIQRLMVLELRLKRPPSAEDYKMALALIDIAAELDPRNPELARWDFFVSHEMGDSARVAAATRHAIAIEPTNTVLQQAMIMGRIGELQTNEERLAALERFIGTAGSSLDPGVRSRLAFEACRLYDERGDLANTARCLKQAISLDPTNKDAASFAVQFYSDRIDDPAGNFDLLTNLLLADPSDHVTLASMAEACASVGAFSDARRFENNAKLIYAGLGGTEKTEDIVKSTVLDWALDGPNKVIADLNKVLADNRQAAAMTIKAMEEQLIPTSGIPKPEEITLDPLLERARVLAGLQVGDEDTITSAVENIVRSLDALLKDLDLIAQGVPGSIPPEQAAARAYKLRADLVSTLLWLQRDPERTAAEFEKLTSDPGVVATDPWIITARAWHSIREGKPADAIESLRPIAAGYTLADVGLATAYELAGDTAAAIERWRAIAKILPLAPDGGWARSRLTVLTKTDKPDPEAASKVRKAAALVPAWVDELATSPKRFLSLRAELVNPDAGRLEPLRIRVVLRNEAPVPLGIGPGRTIGESVVVDAKAEAHIEQLFGAMGAEYFDLTRRFSLAPMQQLEIEDWAEPGLVGWMIESSAHRTIRERWRVLYGFVKNEEGIPVPGPLGLTSETRSVSRTALPEATLDTSTLAQRVRMATDEDLAAAMVAVRSRLLDRSAPDPVLIDPKFRGVDAPKPPIRPNKTELPPEERATLAAACVERYSSATREIRMLMAATLPHELQCAEMKDFDALARQEKDPDVAAVVVVTRVRDAGDPMLDWAKGQSNPRLRDVAAARAGAIDANAKFFANAGPGLYGIVTGVIPDSSSGTPAAGPGTPAPAKPATPPAGNK
ncbi:MAG: hypothetical protein IT432_17265 [Phycisphaerales bacterium]|nr:hypothetical protein [Phycisphaerales bacterium]